MLLAVGNQNEGSDLTWTLNYKALIKRLASLKHKSNYPEFSLTYLVRSTAMCSFKHTFPAFQLSFES